MHFAFITRTLYDVAMEPSLAEGQRGLKVTSASMLMHGTQAGNSCWSFCEGVIVFQAAWKSIANF